MTSQFYWALLGLVIKRPGYGYELARRFEDEYADTLPLRGDSHVYAGLKELESRGLLEPAAVTGSPSSRSGGEPRPGYRATARGRESYRAWLLTRLDGSRRDWMLLARLLGILAVEPEAALEIIESYRQTLLAQASDTETKRMRERRAEPVDGASELVRRLIDEEQRSVVGRMLDWVEFAQREFEALARRRA
ncbi:MAG TPA: helix-turn-helix transcriptional regulator [Solirubrobacteraceae bacterium]|nr:helix-turn-helix transcriptional regulator [Solirubrobacteraceae bacterium]